MMFGCTQAEPMKIDRSASYFHPKSSKVVTVYCYITNYLCTENNKHLLSHIFYGSGI